MIQVFTTKQCAYCLNVKQYLKMKNKEFEEVDVTDDLSKRQELQRITGFITVPITKINDEYIVGWNVSKLAAAL